MKGGVEVEEENKKVKTAVMKIVMEVLPWENH